MRVLILGGDGMLGHRLALHLERDHEVGVTLRGTAGKVGETMSPAGRTAWGDVDVRDFDRVRAVLDDFSPRAVVNCVGVVKQRSDAETTDCIEVNALFPHRLAEACVAGGARLVHLSTDCVFSGRCGGYTEEDLPDPVDAYGRSKLLGEMDREGCLVLRTSFVGPEIRRRHGLLEWLLAQRGDVRGFRGAVFSGLTTMETSRVIADLIERHPDTHGIYHLSSAPISKHALLTAIADALDLPVRVVPDDEIRIDRSLDSARFRARFGYAPPTWTVMIEELVACLSGETRGA